MDRALQQAKKELEEEEFREQVDVCKEKLRYKKSFWQKLIPFKIIIVRRK